MYRREAFCPHCGQLRRGRRAGVFLPPVKVALYDAIAGSGDFGISVAELMRLDVWRDRKRVKPVTVRAHIGQINNYLLTTPWRIVYLEKRYVVVRLAEQKQGAA